MNTVLVKAGARIFTSVLKRKLLGPARYEGSAAEICEQIVRALFDERRRCYRTSLTTYQDLWARDFGRAVPALLSLGFEAEVQATYRYAFESYERAGYFALVVAPDGALYDFPFKCYSPDGFAFFIQGLAALDDKSLIARHWSFLEREARRFADHVVDPRSGLPRRGVHFSEAQDYAVRDSSCYSAVMCFLVQRSLAMLGLPNSLQGHDYRTAILSEYLAGDFFYDDARHAAHVAGDAAVLPFWSGLLGHGELARQLFVRVLERMDAEGLNRPLPTRYGATRAKQTDTIFLDRLNPWQHDTVWTCLGLQLVEALRSCGMSRYKVELNSLARCVEQQCCFPEVLDAHTGQLYRGPVYLSEDSMLWAANLWSLLRDEA